MPIYEYFCVKCQVEFEVILPFSQSDKPVKCARCKTQAQKLLSSFGSKTGSYIQSSSRPLRVVKPIRTAVTKTPKKAKRKKLPAKGLR